MVLLIFTILTVFLQIYTITMVYRFYRNAVLNATLFLASIVSLVFMAAFLVVRFFFSIHSQLLEIILSFFILVLTILIILFYRRIVMIERYTKAVEKEKDECKNMFTELFQNSSDEIFFNDSDGKFLEFNKLVPEILGYSIDELNSLHLYDVCMFKDLQNMPNFVQMLEGGELVFETELKAKSGKIFPVEIKSRLIKQNQKDTILSISRDISERKQIERKILNAIIETEHKERERFSQDLHDQLGNILSSMNIYCELIRSETIGIIEKENLMGYFKGLLNEAILSTKEIANNLNPSLLTKFGIVKSVEEYCEKINQTGLIKIYLSTSIEEDILSKDLELNLYKIITELVNNTLKHASADRVYLALACKGKLLTLKYEDNGTGFDYEKKIKEQSNKGMGLFNISSRVSAIGGRITVESNKFIGTRVQIQAKII